MCRYLGQHENIITLKDLFLREVDDELYIVMELLDSDLHRIIQSKQALSEAHHRFFMHQVCTQALIWERHTGEMEYLGVVPYDDVRR